MIELSKSDIVKRFRTEILSQKEIDMLFQNKEKVLLMSHEEIAKLIMMFNQEHKEDNTETVEGLTPDDILELFNSIPTQKEELQQQEAEEIEDIGFDSLMISDEEFNKIYEDLLREEREGLLSQSELNTLYKAIYDKEPETVTYNRVKKSQEIIQKTLWEVAERFKLCLSQQEREILFDEE